MAGIQELIRVEDDKTISFGNHIMEEKKKVLDFEVDGDIYKVKTYNKITKLEKNGQLLYESLPGTTVHHFYLDEKDVDFEVEGVEDAQIILGLEASHEYRILIDGVQVGKTKSNLAGKVNISVDFNNGLQKVEIKRA